MMVDRDQAAGMSLRDLLQGLVDELPAAGITVGGISLDSRSINPGDLFIALRGYRCDGREFIDQAIERGAAAVLVESDASRPLDTEQTASPVISIRELRAKTGIIAARFHHHPSRALQVIGITGTNGKTSVCHFLTQVLDAVEAGSAGCIGTLGHGVWPDLQNAANTTPDAVTLQGLLNDFSRRSVRRAVMEVSSHALEQGRVNGTDFDIAVFTNISHDHLDFHGDMERYVAAKQKLFQSEGLRHAVINVDDPFGAELYRELSRRMHVTGYGLATTAGDGDGPGSPEVSATLIDQDTGGLTLHIRSPWGEGELRANLVGRFNAYNLIAALSVLCLLDIPLDTVLAKLAGVHAVPGRMEVFGNDRSPGIVVDYAHTPDALEQALSRLRELCRGELVCVFGCGGDRDTAKRPLMGRVAERYADRVVITSDNPRNEMPEKIIDEIAAGMQGDVETIVDSDRASAIRYAIESCGPEDVVLIAGKGHETWQEVSGRRYPFSDRQLVRNLLEALS